MSMYLRYMDTNVHVSQISGHVIDITKSQLLSACPLLRYTGLECCVTRNS